MEKHPQQTNLQAFNDLTKEIEDCLSYIGTVTVSSFDEANKTIIAGKVIYDLLKKIDKRRKELTEPFKKEAKRIDNYAKEISAPLEKAQDKLKHSLAHFEDEQRRIRQDKARAASESTKEEYREIEQQVAIPGSEDDIFGIAASRRDLADTRLKQELYDIKEQGIRNARRIWKCELLDMKLVPEHFKIVELNTQAVLAATRGGQVEIPGVRVYQETSIGFGNAYVPRGALE